MALNDGPLHGYAVLKAAGLSSAPGPFMGPSTIYGTLARLVDRGFVEVSRRSRGGGRKRYSLTPAGHRALWAEAARIVRLADLVRERNLVE